MKELLDLYNIHIGGSIVDFHNLVSMWGISGIQIVDPDPILDKIRKKQHLEDVFRVKNWILDNSKQL
jgi:hypothetical protein